MPRFQEAKPIPIEDARGVDFNISGQPVHLWLAPEGCLLDIRDQYTTNRSNGLFRAVLEMGTLLTDRSMSGSSVPLDKRWTAETLPQDIEVAEFIDTSGTVARAADLIRHIVNNYTL